MKNLELEGFGLVEMSHDEMVESDGGSWFGDAIRWIVDHTDEIATVALIVGTAVGAYISSTR